MDPRCTGKKRYTSWTEAEGAARWQRRRHGITFRPYHCRTCHGIHTGEESPGNDTEKRDRRRRQRTAREPEEA